MSDTCPDCTHPKAAHSFVGCIGTDDPLDPCECVRDFPEYAKATNPQRAEAEKTEAMAKAERGTDPEWAAKAERICLHLANRVDAFTPDLVWATLEEEQVPPPREPRALGPVLQRLVRQGKLKHTGYAPSNRRHKSPVGVYTAGPEL